MSSSLQPPRRRLDADFIRGELATERGACLLIAGYGLKVRRAGAWWRLKECPRCHRTSSSWGIAIRVNGRAWVDHASADCGGDLFDLIGTCEGFDARADFGHALERAATLLGIDADDVDEAELARRDAERRQRALDEARQERERLERAKTVAPNVWQQLMRYGWSRQAGHDYLRSRGLDPKSLVKAGHVLFDEHSNPVVPFWAYDGDMINCVRRLRVPLDGKKVLSMTGCPHRGGTYLGRLQEIQRGDIVMLTEGVVDSLTAAQLWPRRIILGAPGAGQLEDIAEHAAPRIVERGARLVLVPHQDEIGVRRMIAAGRVAQAVGLMLDRELEVLDVAPHKDLNAAHVAGWRP